MDTERLVVRALAVAKRMVGPTPEADVASATAGAALRCAKAWDPARAGHVTFEVYVAYAVRRACGDCYRRKQRHCAKVVPLICAEQVAVTPDYDAMTEETADALLEVWAGLDETARDNVRAAADPDEAIARLYNFRANHYH